MAVSASRTGYLECQSISGTLEHQNQKLMLPQLLLWEAGFIFFITWLSAFYLHSQKMFCPVTSLSSDGAKQFVCKLSIFERRMI